MLGLVGLAACGGSSVETAVQVDAKPQVRTWLEGNPERGVATLTVQVRLEQGAEASFPRPEIDGLTLTPVGAPDQERVGGLDVFTRRYRLTGPPGSYQVPPLSVGETGRDSAPLWFDLGQPAPELDGFAEISDPAAVFSLNTPLIVGVACAGLGTLGGLGALGLLVVPRLIRRSSRSAPPDPPDVIALRSWEQVRADSSLDDHEVAVRIAAILRTYMEAVLDFPATALTTREILDHLDQLDHLPEGNVGRARTILRATDYIKFADATAREALFDELDEALRGFVGSTRPRGFEVSS